MKRKWLTVFTLTLIVIIIGVAAFRWDARYGGQNAVDIENAKASLARGRGFEVLQDGSTYLTDDANFSELLYFLEGQYGVQLTDFDDKTVLLSGDHGDIAFKLTAITSFGEQYYIWEREN